MSNSSPSVPELLDHVKEGQKLQKLILENTRLQQKLLDREQDRQIRAMKATARVRLKEALIENLLPYIPLIVNKLRGKRVLPETVHPDIEQLKLFFASVKEGEFEHLVSVFGSRIAPLLDLLAKYKDEFDEKERKKAEQADSVTPKTSESHRP